MDDCYIIGPMWHGEHRDMLTKDSGDFVLCADGGLDRAVQYGIRPDLVIGDFDSMPETHVRDVPYVKLPVMKDDTDMRVCIQEGRKRGYRKFYILGGMGGRLDHTMANLQCLAECASLHEEAWLLDERNCVTVFEPGTYRFDARDNCYLSLFAYTETVEDLSLQGTQWTLEHATLKQTYPVGVSNECVEETVSLSFKTGLLMLMWCKKDH